MNTLKFLGTNSNPKASPRLLEVIIATNKKKDTQNSVFQYFFVYSTINKAILLFCCQVEVLRILVGIAS